MSDKEKLFDLIQFIIDMSDAIRQKYGSDDVCGLCEWDGPAWMECPGFESDKCFRLDERFALKYLTPEQWKEMRAVYGWEEIVR